MIEYLYTEGQDACEKEPLKVRLHDGHRYKIIGAIKKVEGGYQYFPKGHKTGGDIFPSVGLVQKSLTDEE